MVNLKREQHKKGERVSTAIRQHQTIAVQTEPAVDQNERLLEGYLWRNIGLFADALSNGADPYSIACGRSLMYRICGPMLSIWVPVTYPEVMRYFRFFPQALRLLKSRGVDFGTLVPYQDCPGCIGCRVTEGPMVPREEITAFLEVLRLSPRSSDVLKSGVSRSEIRAFINEVTEILQN